MDHITPYKQATCGCCTGDGSGYGMPGNDQCICFMHQDTPRGQPPKICAYHKRLKVYTAEQMERVDQAIAELEKLLQERRERIAAESQKAASDAWSRT